MQQTPSVTSILGYCIRWSGMGGSGTEFGGLFRISGSGALRSPNSTARVEVQLLIEHLGLHKVMYELFLPEDSFRTGLGSNKPLSRHPDEKRVVLLPFSLLYPPVQLYLQGQKILLCISKLLNVSVYLQP